MPGSDAKAQPAETLLTKEDAQRIVAEGAHRYFESRRARVDEFVDRHFSLSGSLAMHRKAIGWDILKAPANIALAVPQIATKLAAAGAKAMGADKAAAYLASRKLVFDTEVGSVDRVMPNRRTPLRMGKSAESSSRLACSSMVLLWTLTGKERLRVIC